MFTVPSSLNAGLIKEWQPQNRPAVRQFLYRPEWVKRVNALPEPTKTKGLTRDISPRGRVFGCAERFARGDCASSLITPTGDAMSPAFKRMRYPNEAVVEMRTSLTRTFGFFADANVYVAVTLETIQVLKRKQLPDEINFVDPYSAPADEVQRFLKYFSPQSVDTKTNVEFLVSP